MQASQTAHDFYRNKEQIDRYKPVKYIQSDHNNQHLSKVNQNRSMSSTFRQSIRRLTSCASAR